jgi:hypothetical protein
MVKRLLVVIAWTLASGCDSPTAVDDQACYALLESYCATWPCPSYDQSLAEVVGQAPRCQAIVAQTGQCGTLAFTRLGFGFGNTTRYYSASNLVAVHATSDAVAVGSPCPDWKHYGQRLSCRETNVADVCRR